MSSWSCSLARSVIFVCHSLPEKPLQLYLKYTNWKAYPFSVASSSWSSIPVAYRDRESPCPRSPLHKSAPTPFHEEAEGNRRKRCRPRFRFGDRSEGDHIIPIVVIEAVVGTSCIFSRWIFPRPEKPQRETATDTISRAFGITTKPSASRKAEIFRPSRCACIAKTARRKMKL